MDPALIIFDCDGVLIDSEVISADVLIDLARDHGLALNRDHVREHFLGRSFPTVARMIRETFRLDFATRFRGSLPRRTAGPFRKRRCAPPQGLPICSAVLFCPFAVPHPRVRRVWPDRWRSRAWRNSWAARLYGVASGAGKACARPVPVCGVHNGCAPRRAVW